MPETELFRLRRRFGLTRRAISDVLGVSEMSVFRWETGRVKAPHPHLGRKLSVLIEILGAKKRGTKDE
jgi:DNA-binding transcriptional regulator YiaG